MIACVSPSEAHLSETLDTLKFAQRARRIRNKPAVNIDPTTDTVASLRVRLEAAEVKIAEAGDTIRLLMAAGRRLSSKGTNGGGRVQIAGLPQPGAPSRARERTPLAVMSLAAGAEIAGPRASVGKTSKKVGRKSSGGKENGDPDTFAAAVAVATAGGSAGGGFGGGGVLAEVEPEKENCELFNEICRLRRKLVSPCLLIRGDG